MPRKSKRPKLTDEGFQLVAQRFKVLSEPVRLKLLAVLEDGEQNVGQLVTLTGQSQVTSPSTSPPSSPPAWSAVAKKA